jgi:hypothetical protein
MTQENVGAVRGLFEAIARRDLGAFLAGLDEDVEWVSPASLPWGGTYHGPAEVGARYFARVFEHVDDDLALEAEELFDSGDRVVGRGWLRGRARASGIAFETPFVDLWTLRDARVARLEYHVDTAIVLGALAAQRVA